MPYFPTAGAAKEANLADREGGEIVVEKEFLKCVCLGIPLPAERPRPCTEGHGGESLSLATGEQSGAVGSG